MRVGILSFKISTFSLALLLGVEGEARFAGESRYSPSPSSNPLARISSISEPARNAMFSR